LRNKMVVTGLCLMFLVGCDEASNTQTSVASQAAEQGLESADSTAIYLRSGVGLDFGRKPLVDREVVQESGKYRQVTFLFDESPEAIDASVKGVLEAGGYKRELIRQEKYKLQVYYRKAGFEKTDLANTIYTEVPVEGGVKTQLLFGFSID